MGRNCDTACVPLFNRLRQTAGLILLTRLTLVGKRRRSSFAKRAVALPFLPRFFSHRFAHSSQNDLEKRIRLAYIGQKFTQSGSSFERQVQD